MDPLSITAGILAVATAAQQTRKVLDQLRTALKTMPGRLSSINNQVADLEVLLHQIASLIKSRDAHPELGSDESYAEIRKTTDGVQKLLGELRDISVRVEAAGKGDTRIGAMQRMRSWQRHLPRMHAIQEELSHAKITLNLLLGASHSHDMMQVRLDLVAVTGLPSGQGISQDEMLRRLFEHIDDRVESVKSAVAQQTQELTQSQMALLGGQSDNLGSPPPYTSRRSSSSSSIKSLPAERVGLVVASRTSACRPRCRCVCHKNSKTASPSFLNRVLGQLFVEHAGVPLLSTKCDMAACVNAQKSQVSAEYWFPYGIFWSQIIRIHATYQANLGPSLQLRTLRRVPDSSPAVSFAMAGNIHGLQELFRRGAASPQDVSETRGYSLMRWALYSQQYKAVKFLYYAGADPDYRPKAISDNCPSNKAADIIMQGGLPDDVVEDLSCVASDEWIEEQQFPLLHRIVLGLNGRDLEQALAEDPECVDDVDAMGRTALLWAAARGDHRSVTTLLSFNADPNIMDCQHAGPVSYAADRNHTVCARILLEAGAETDPVIPGGYRIGSPLNCAARNASDPMLLKTLIDFGADVDACGVDGRTALIHAARTNNVSFAILLLEGGANINAVSTAGQTPLTTAIVNNSHGVLQLLLNRWSDYTDCPRLRGPHLIDVAAQFADHETLAILSLTNHIRLKFDRNYHEGDFLRTLQMRHDGDDKLSAAFADFMSIVREEVSPEELMEQGMSFDKLRLDDYDDLSEKSSEVDEFHDAKEDTLIEV